jgi:leader peptidase (prepilin peptidase)/N-methyltransferase
MVGILGLLVGSFLNVIIYRLPRMHTESYTLSFPRSFCTACHTSIRFYDNIPLLSYCFLQGKCRSCENTIPYRYPLVEALTCLLSLLIVWHFGTLDFKSCFALLLTWALVALSFIDFEHSLLPDSITLPFVWIGLLLNLVPVFSSAESCILGAVLGYMSLWTVYQLFKYLTHKEGMGYGDFKLLAMLGAWLGWQAIPLIILIASLFGSIIGLSLIFFKNKDKDMAIPFGPYLALGGFITLLWQDDLLRFYLQFLL